MGGNNLNNCYCLELAVALYRLTQKQKSVFRLYSYAYVNKQQAPIFVTDTLYNHQSFDSIFQRKNEVRFNTVLLHLMAHFIEPFETKPLAIKGGC